jgi:hypothetical protein
MSGTTSRSSTPKRARSTRELPAALDAERNLLGAMLLQRSAVEPALVLDSADFATPAHGHVFAAIVGVYRAGDVPDVLAVAEELRRVDLLEVVGGVEYVQELMAATPAVSNNRRHARAISDAAMRRRLIAAGTEIAELGWTRDGDVDQAVAAAWAQLDTVGRSEPDDEVDLGPIIDALQAGDDPGPHPELLVRSDGGALLYRGSITLMFAPGGTGKTLLAYVATAERLAAGETVVWLDYEQSPKTVVTWLMWRLGVDPDALRTRFRYRAAHGFPVARYRPLVASVSPGLVVIDALVGALAAEEHIDSENDNLTIRRWFDGQLRPFADLGAVVVALDHVTVATNGDTRNNPRGRPRGAGGKMDGSDLAYELTVAEPFNRERAGSLRLHCWKDRHGAIGSGRVVAEARIEPTARGQFVNVTLAPVKGTPDGEPFRPTFLMERVSRYVESNPGANTKAIRGLKGNHDALDVARERLVAEGYMRVERKGSAHCHYSIKPYRESDDERADE